MAIDIFDLTLSEPELGLISALYLAWLFERGGSVRLVGAARMSADVLAGALGPSGLLSLQQRIDRLVQSAPGFQAVAHGEG